MGASPETIDNQITAADAEEYTAAMRQVFSGLSETVEGGWRLIASGIRQGVPKAQGLDNRTWADGVMPRQRYSLLQRQEIVAELFDDGMSQRAIADVLGVDEKTVRNDRADGAENSALTDKKADDDEAFAGGGAEYSASDDTGSGSGGDTPPTDAPTSEAPDQEAADLFTAGTEADDDGAAEMARLRLRRQFSTGLKHAVELVNLKPEALAEIADEDLRHHITYNFRNMRRWMDEVEQALPTGIRRVV